MNPLDLPKEALCLELSLSLEHSANGWSFIRHPLVTTLYSEQLNASYNALLKDKKAQLEEYILEQKWEQAVWLHERPWRLFAFKHCAAPHLPAPAAGDLLTEIWKDAEFPFVQRSGWLSMFRKYRNVSPAMIQSRKHLSSTDRILVYRGASKLEGTKRRPYGMSWTLDKSVAQFFAGRFNTDGSVLEFYVDPQNIFHYAPERGEQEVVIKPPAIGAIPRHR